MFQPIYTLTDALVRMLTEIAEGRSVISRAKLLPKQELRLRRQALVRMTHSSTSIEGNILNMHEVEALINRQKVDAPDRDVHEVKNYLQALKYIESVVKAKKPLTRQIVLRIHKLVTEDTLRANASGHYRNAPVYIVRRHSGGRQEIMYTAAPAKHVPSLMNDLIAWVNASDQEQINPVIVAGVLHQEFAAIHPFFDGNGRTTRALATLVLYQRGYDFRRLFALEDYYNDDRPSYYTAINVGKDYETRRKDFTPWLQYFVLGFKEEISAVTHQVMSLSVKKLDAGVASQVFLDKEQVTILDFIETVGRITISDVVDILHCPKRSAQLQLQKLKKLKMIASFGKGRATYYTLKK